MTVPEILARLEATRSDQIKRILLRDGAREPILGVRIEELQKIRKEVRKNHALALELFDTGVYDAQYLAGLIADEKQATPEQLRAWLAAANSQPIASFAVAWLAAETPYGLDLAREWIESSDERTAHTGWNVLNSVVALRSDLNRAELEALLDRVERTPADQPDGIRYAMNSYVIAVGVYEPELTERALAVGERLGRVQVDMGDTDCKVPYAPDYIRKAQDRGKIGKKRKMARC